MALLSNLSFLGKNIWLEDQLILMPSKRDGVHRTENFVEIIPVFSFFLNFFKKKKKKKK